MKILVSDKFAPEGIDLFKSAPGVTIDYKTGLKRSEEHTSELQSPY